MMIARASLDRFSHIALKLTLGFQNLCSFFTFALFDDEIYPLEPILKGCTGTDTSLAVISVRTCSYLCCILDICFQWDSKLKNIHINFSIQSNVVFTLYSQREVILIENS